MAAAAARRGIPFRSFQPKVQDGRDLYGCDLALVRPDMHVCWRGNRMPDDCDALFARVTGW